MLVLDIGFKTYRLSHSDIEQISFRTLRVQIEHQNPDVPEHLDLNGFLISNSLRNAIIEHGVPVKMES
jgi:hypothetical protein